MHDLDSRRMRELERRYDVIGEPELRRAVAPANMVVLAVRPGCGGGSIRPYRAATAGVDPGREADHNQKLGASTRLARALARAMPSLCAGVGA